MRDLILEATRTGRIEDLRVALEWNELRPDLGIDRTTDAIAHFQRESQFGDGAETLAVLADLLMTRPTRLKIGRDLENNDVFVWPGIAETDLKALPPSDRVTLWRILPPDIAAETVRTGRWLWYRLAIGADGTWHVFKKTP